jgi:serine/threonine protein phosphatase PrpC
MNLHSAVDAPIQVAMGNHGGIDAAGMTNVGLSREGNEDAFLIATLQRSLIVHQASAAAKNGGLRDSLSGTLLMVADGMGGEGRGDVASRIAVSTVASYLLNVMPWVSSAAAPTGEVSCSGIGAQLPSALIVGDSCVKIAAQHSTTPHMGTTLTLALVLWPTLYVAHVGDTRCYLLREGQFSRLTTDHTLAQKVLDDAVESVPPDSQLHHLLWNSLGGSKSLPEPQIVKLDLKPGDRLLLCSDGLTKHVSDPEILLALSTGEPNATQCARLIELANAGGGSDNVTVLVATVPLPTTTSSTLGGRASVAESPQPRLSSAPTTPSA